MKFHGIPRTWARVAAQLKDRPRGALLRVEKHMVQHPGTGAFD
jgi:hypothetical protein